jgi:hypothetical protein
METLHRPRTAGFSIRSHHERRYAVLFNGFKRHWRLRGFRLVLCLPWLVGPLWTIQTEAHHAWKKPPWRIDNSNTQIADELPLQAEGFPAFTV